VLFRIVYVLWVFGVFALWLAAIADTLFGNLPLSQRLKDVLPRMAIAVLWPLALMTPRGRFLLWARWRGGV